MSSVVGARLALNVGLAVILTIIVVALMLGPPVLGPHQRSELQAAAISSVDPLEVTQVSFHSPPARPFTLRRGAHGWRLATPLDLPANNLKVSTLLAVATAPTTARFPAPRSGLGGFGLSPPLVTLALDEHRFDLGDTEPLDGRRYVLHGSELSLIEDTAFRFIGSGPEDFANPAPLAGATRVLGVTLPGRSMRWLGSTWQIEGFEGTTPDWLNHAAESWLRAQAVVVQAAGDASRFESTVDFDLEGPQEHLRFALRLTEHEVILARLDLGIEYRLLRRAVEPLLSGPDSRPASPVNSASE